MSETNPMSDAEKVVAELRLAERIFQEDPTDDAACNCGDLFKRAADLIAQQAAREEALTKERDEALDLAKRSTRRLAETADPGFIGAFARRDAAIAERDQFRDRLTAAEAEVGRLREALKPFAETEPMNVWREEEEDAGDYVLTENQFRFARACLSPSKKEG